MVSTFGKYIHYTYMVGVTCNFKNTLFVNVKLYIRYLCDYTIEIFRTKQ